jgi:hypothetical protein
VKRPRKGHRKKRDFVKAYRDFYRRTVEEAKLIVEVEARLLHKPALRPAGHDLFTTAPADTVPVGKIRINQATGKMYVSDGTIWVEMP